MSNIGYYKSSFKNGIIDQELDTAIHNFQKDKDLKVDGYMEPGGETEQSLTWNMLNKARKNSESKKVPIEKSKAKKDAPSPTEIEPEKESDKQNCEESAIEIKNYREHRDGVAEDISEISDNNKVLEEELEEAKEELRELAATTGTRVGYGRNGCL